MSKIEYGNCLEVLKAYPNNYFHSIVTDPPYGLAFMGKKWDYDVPSVEIWQECLRVLKPGGHLLSFAGTRTQHRMAVNIEDAGWEIRDQIMWVYGSGFPKSLDVSKAIDKAAGAEGAVIGERRFGKTSTGQSSGWNDNAVAATGRQDIREPATDAAKQWHGWGTALKPALEPITMARKPLEGTVAANVLEHGTGAINVDGCRVGVEPSPSALMCASDRVPSSCKPGEYGDTIQNRITPERWQEARPGEQLGRWPANLIHDGSDEVVGLFPEQANGGSAARFFYCAKTSKKERGDGNNHPTVKPQKLMEYLIKLVTPPGGIILDPFAGSGSTGIAAKRLGFDFVLIEMDHEYCKIIERRLNG